MTIVQVSKRRGSFLTRRAHMILAGSIVAATLTACVTQNDQQPDYLTPDYLTHEEARQEVLDAYQGYPPVGEAREVILVGVGCGPDKETIVLTGGEEDDFIWQCENIEAHGSV